MPKANLIEGEFKQRHARRPGLEGWNNQTPLQRLVRKDTNHGNAGSGGFIGGFIDWEYLELSKDLFLKNLPLNVRQLFLSGKLTPSEILRGKTDKGVSLGIPNTNEPLHLDR